MSEINNAIHTKMNVLLMFASPYEMKDDKTFEITRGVSVEYYLFDRNGSNLEPVMNAGDGKVGTRRNKDTLNYDLKDKVAYVPGIYSGEFEMGAGSDGKLKLKLLDIDFLGKFSFANGFTEIKTEPKAEPKK